MLSARHWLVYAVITTVLFTAIFLLYRLGSQTMNPFFFAFIVNAINFIGHAVNVGRLRMTQKVSLAVPASMIGLACLIGLCVSSNDVNAVLIFGAGAPMSVAMPVLSSAIVLLTVLFGVMLLRERLSKIQILGMVCAVIGIGLLNV